ncbi:MAG TPA: hypothetical protein VGK49_07485 [Ilumatobacteraceae bacterium]
MIRGWASAGLWVRWSDPWSDPEIEDFGPWNDAFTDAMRPVYEAHPDDLDAVAVFVEAGMNRTPWLHPR